MGKMHHYTESGLDNIFLQNGFRIDKEGTLFIEDIHGLHKAIGERLVFQQRKLKAKEIRFIRHFMDLSQKAFGEILGVDYQTVLRWETSRNVITKTADRFLKVVFNEFLDPTSKARNVIDIISDLDNERNEKIELTHNHEWKEAA